MASPRGYESVFLPSALVEHARGNDAAWAVSLKERVLESARPWLAMSHDELWALVFGNRLKRAWQVWSSGHCPACRGALPEYSWEMDAFARPWKTRCPHCREIYPKNDFERFYRSGIDGHGEFDPALADRTLLFNEEHPDPADPLHGYGVDDGEGWRDGENRWRFVSAYLIYGQWKQLVVGGVTSLAAAYVVCGRPEYARKALILLDRIADVYPSMDFHEQGLVYEGQGHRGYVSTWHDACREAYDLALAYDSVRPALAGARELVAFLHAKAQQYQIARPKKTPADIKANIEDNILRHTIDHRDRIESNFPGTDLSVIALSCILDWDGGRGDIEAHLDDVLARATAVDGVTGEKGLSAYAASTFQGIMAFLASLSQIDDGFFKGIVKRHPRIHTGLRFFIDTWCMQRYYPSCGDAGGFALPTETYAGAGFESYAAGSEERSGAALRPSMYRLMWRMYQLAGDVALLQVMHHANDTEDGRLRFGLFHDVPPGVQGEFDAAIARHGPRLSPGSVDKQQWHLAVVRSGQGEHARALWLAYDTGRNHQHFDAMNLGLFAHGLDLLTDLGYPPTGYGGHETLQALWYVHTAAHNTVVVDGRRHPGPHWTSEVLAAGTTSLWIDTGIVNGLRCDAPGVYEGLSQYERTAWMADVSERDFYVFDVFRVKGGGDHAKLTHSQFADLTTEGLALSPGENFIEDALLRGFQVDPSPAEGWTADFRIDDRHGAGAPASDVHLHVTDLTRNASAATLECWVDFGAYSTREILWIPTIMTRRRSDAGELASTFVAVMQPCDGAPFIRGARRCALTTSCGDVLGDSHVAVEVVLADAGRDLNVAMNVGPHHDDGPVWAKGEEVRIPSWRLAMDCEACFVRAGDEGQVQRVVACNGTYLRIGDREWGLPSDAAILCWP